MDVSVIAALVIDVANRSAISASSVTMPLWWGLCGTKDAYHSLGTEAEQCAMWPDSCSRYCSLSCQSGYSYLHYIYTAVMWLSADTFCTYLLYYYHRICWYNLYTWYTAYTAVMWLSADTFCTYLLYYYHCIRWYSLYIAVISHCNAVVLDFPAIINIPTCS